MLSGNAPYYVGGVSDEFLDKRLSIEPKQTLLLQNIEQLASVSYHSVVLVVLSLHNAN